MNTSTFLRLLRNSTNLYIQRKSIPRNKCHLIPILGSSNMSTDISISQSNEKETFQDVFPCILDTMKHHPKLANIPDVGDWIKKILEYNLAGGKKNRGLTTVFAYEMLEQPENITEESMKLARIMGWCVEMLQAYFIMADDIMDESTTRRGVPCWYRLPEVGLGAINDCILVYSSLFHILKTNFGNTPQYASILDLFNETILLTSAGQHMDYTMANRKKDDYSLFTVERYEAIVKYKTAYYSYKLPICLGLLLANITDKNILDKVEDISLDFGKFFQIQDDFIDCYSDESVSGKAGTDIQEGKCSWLAVTALQRCKNPQKSIFTQCYGSKDPTHLERIKQLYDVLELPRIYKEQESSQYNAIMLKARKLHRDTNINPKLFFKLLNMIYNRKQ